MERILEHLKMKFENRVMVFSIFEIKAVPGVMTGQGVYPI